MAASKKAGSGLDLHAQVLQLRMAYAVASTAVAALEGQAADRDIEIAHALTRCVLDPLGAVLEALGAQETQG